LDKKAREIENLNSRIKELARTASSNLEEALRIVRNSPASRLEKRIAQRRLAEALDALQGVKGIVTTPERETHEEWKERREERKKRRSERLKGMKEQADV
jgi:hypothetical protein